MEVAQIYLCGLLTMMGVAQLCSWARFTKVLVAYGLRSPRAWAGVLVAGELGAAALLVPEPSRLVGGLLALLVALVWSAIALRAFIQRRRITNCGCFGGYLPQPLRWWVLVQDVAFIGLAGLATFQAAVRIPGAG